MSLLNTAKEMTKKRLSKCISPEVKRSRMDNNYSILISNKSENLFPLDFVEDLEKDQTFTDGTIRTSDGGYFRIHRYFVSIHSSFLYALFLNKLSDTGELTDVTISMISEEMMAVLINFMYGRQVEFTEDNIMDILFVADLFQVEELVMACSEFLISRLRMNLAVPILKATEILYTPTLTSATVDFFLNSFPKMYESQREYRYLTVEQIEKFLRDDHLNLCSEDMTYEIVMDWLKYDQNNRSPHILRLLRTVRFGLLKTYRLPESRTLSNQRLISTSPEAVHYLQQVQELLKTLKTIDCGSTKDKTSFSPSEIELKPSSKRSPRHSSVALNSPPNVDILDSNYLRRPRVPPNVIFAVGGWSAGRAISVLETYDCRANKWYMCTESDTCPRYQAYHGVVVLDNKMYVAGGFDGTSYFSSSRRFDPSSGTWSECSHMTDARCYVSTVTLGGKIYAIGGHNNVNRLKTCDAYDPVANQWTKMADMAFERSDADATVFQDEIYIIGGFTGANVLSSVEKYNPATNSWRLVADMEEVRSGVSVVQHGKYIYALGGYNGTQRLSSVERFDPVNDSWRKVKPMKTPRSNFTAVEMDGYIYAIGGFDGTRTTRLCERYDPSQDSWAPIASLNTDRSALASCVFSQLKNRKHYTSHGQVLDVTHPV